MNEINCSPKTSQKKPIVICCVALAVILIVTSVVLVLDIFQYNTGVVTKITTRAKNNDELELKMTYFLPMGGYSVREVPESEGEYAGDGMIDYDGSLGQYRIMIHFGDIKPHDSFTRKMSEDGILEQKNSTVPLKAKLVFPSDHGFVLYIGSDTPIHIEHIENKGLNGLGGIIKIPIIVGDTE